MHAYTVVGVAMMVACAGDSTSESTVEQYNQCPWYLCSNSPEIGHEGVWEANLWGVPDINGVSIKTGKGGGAVIIKGNVPYQLYVQNGQIRGVRNSFVISGKNLVGARIPLLKYGVPFYDITISDVRPAGISFTAGNPDPIETYVLNYVPPGAPPSSGKPFCNEQLVYTSDAKTFELYGMLNNELVVYEGDRFDTALKTMSTSADNTWFNFGCAGHALAKLYITRNTVNSQPQPDWAVRQSVFKMLVGDYCGARNNRGETFTLTGEPIAWKGGLQADFPIEATLTTNEPPLDARWDEAGATCLYEPRMQISSNPEAPTLFPNARKQIIDACPTIPICTDTDPNALDGARIVSANRVAI
jgi:hypothetical protein